MYEYCNVNPKGKHVGDCVVRAIAKAFGKTWKAIYLDLCLTGYMYYDMPSSNAIWHKYLKQKGLKRRYIPDTCEDCYTINDFCNEYPEGIYIVGTGTHTVCVINGVIYDTWDSGDETPVYYWKVEEAKNG